MRRNIEQRHDLSMRVGNALQQLCKLQAFRCRIVSQMADDDMIDRKTAATYCSAKLTLNRHRHNATGALADAPCAFHIAPIISLVAFLQAAHPILSLSASLCLSISPAQLHFASLPFMSLQVASLNCTALHWRHDAALHCTALHCSALHFTLLHHSIPAYSILLCSLHFSSLDFHVLSCCFSLLSLALLSLVSPYLAYTTCSL